MEVALYNRQRAVPVPIERLKEVARDAVPLCLGYPGRAPSVLTNLAAVEITVVSDRVITRVHRQFMNVPGATDVITFPHGEIVISAVTAERQARENDESTEREIARYIVHGLLHLHGHEDAESDEAAAMWQTQETVLSELWPPATQRRSKKR